MSIRNVALFCAPFVWAGAIAIVYAMYGSDAAAVVAGMPVLIALLGLVGALFVDILGE